MYWSFPDDAELWNAVGYAATYVDELIGAKGFDAVMDSLSQLHLALELVSDPSQHYDCELLTFAANGVWHNISVNRNRFAVEVGQSSVGIQWCAFDVIYSYSVNIEGWFRCFGQRPDESEAWRAAALTEKIELRETLNRTTAWKRSGSYVRTAQGSLFE